MLQLSQQERKHVLPVGRKASPSLEVTPAGTGQVHTAVLCLTWGPGLPLTSPAPPGGGLTSPVCKPSPSPPQAPARGITSNSNNNTPHVGSRHVPHPRQSPFHVQGGEASGSWKAVKPQAEMEAGQPWGRSRGVHGKGVVKTRSVPCSGHPLLPTRDDRYGMAADISDGLHNVPLSANGTQPLCRMAVWSAKPFPAPLALGWPEGPALANETPKSAEGSREGFHVCHLGTAPHPSPRSLSARKAKITRGGLATVLQP